MLFTLDGAEADTTNDSWHSLHDLEYIEILGA